MSFPCTMIQSPREWMMILTSFRVCFPHCFLSFSLSFRLLLHVYLYRYMQMKDWFTWFWRERKRERETSSSVHLTRISTSPPFPLIHHRSTGFLYLSDFLHFMSVHETLTNKTSLTLIYLSVSFSPPCCRFDPVTQLIERRPIATTTNKKKQKLFLHFES